MNFLTRSLLIFVSLAIGVTGQTPGDTALPKVLTPSKFRLPQEDIDAGIGGTIMVTTKVNEK